MYKVFGTEALLAQDVNEILRQTVIQCADADELAMVDAPDAGMMAYRADTETTYRHDGMTWVPVISDTGWVDVALASGWTADYGPQVRRVGNVIYWRGRITPTTARTGTQTPVVGGTVPEWARPLSIFDTIRPLPSNHSSSIAETAFKNGAVGADGSITVWYGASNSDPVVLSALSGYTPN